jgi:HTH-type transcriptional regulator/antitoxin HipB
MMDIMIVAERLMQGRFSPGPVLSPATILRMTQGKRISADIGGNALQAIREIGMAAKVARTGAGEGQAAAAARLGVHVQTIGRIEAGEPGVAIGHVLGLLALYDITVKLEPVPRGPSQP